MDTTDEIERNLTLAEAALDAMGTDRDDLQTAVTDAIATLLIFAHERDLNVADAVFKGAAHWAATYMEPMSADDAAAWMHDELHAFSGEHGADHYIAEQAIILAGHQYKVAPPEFGI